MPEQAFMPNPASAYETPTVFHSDSTMAGIGSPEGVIPAWPGSKYVDTDTGDRYTKESGDGTLTGWTADGSGGGGAGGLEGSGSPEGVETAEPGATYWDSSNNIFYVKASGSGNTGWRELIA
jgi:hypothetical protein